MTSHLPKMLDLGSQTTRLKTGRVQFILESNLKLI